MTNKALFQFKMSTFHRMNTLTLIFKKSLYFRWKNGLEFRRCLSSFPEQQVHIFQNIWCDLLNQKILMSYIKSGMYSPGQYQPRGSERNFKSFTLLLFPKRLLFIITFINRGKETDALKFAENNCSNLPYRFYIMRSSQ